jgi:hypothetical protein
MSTTKTFVELATEAANQGLTAMQQAQDLSLAVASEVPSPAAVIEWSFDTARKSLEQQRAYALRLTEIVAAAPSRPAKP